MRNTAYSTYSSVLWKHFKGFHSLRSEENFCGYVAGQLDEWIDQRSAMRFAHTAVVGQADFLWRFRKLEHYFLAPGVAEFCAGSVKEFSGAFAKRLPACDLVDGSRTDPVCFPFPLDWFSAGPAGKIQGGFAIHFPADEDNRSVIVIPEALMPGPNGECIRWYCAATDGDAAHMSNHQNGQSADGGNRSAWIGRLVYGVSLYMDAFPDAVVEVDADAIQQCKYYRGRRRFVGRNEIVEEEHRHGVSPHWRRGHFRLLSSERFVRKSGQTVYVRGTFVKGKAFAVLDDAPPVFC